MVRILIADDNAPVRSRLRSLLSECPDWSVCGEAVDGIEAVEKSKALKPDVVLMDVSMPRMDGLKATKIIHREMPDIRVIVVSQNDPSITSRAAADTGAKASVSKFDVSQELIPAIEKVLAAQTSTSPEASTTIVRPDVRHEVKLALQESEERYQSLLELLRDRTAELEQRNADVIEKTEQLRELSNSLLTIQENERRHVARELHDSAGNILTVLSLTLAKAPGAARRSRAELEKVIAETQQLVQQLGGDLRTMSYLLHPPLLEESGLPSAVRWYIDGLAERSDLQVSLHIAGDFPRLPREMELMVFRLIQECLTNVHRHSGSKSAEIRMMHDPGSIRIEVQDRGKGMSPQKLAEVQSQGAGVGIRGMRERLLHFGGKLTIQSDPSGTTVSVKVPLAAADPANPQAPLRSHVVG